MSKLWLVGQDAAHDVITRSTWHIVARQLDKPQQVAP